MYPTLFTTPGVADFATAVDTERQAQLAKWGDQRHADGTGAQHYVAMADEAREDVELFVGQHSGPEWALVLLEEVYEALAESDPVKLRTELVQAAAVIAAWVSDLDRRTAEEQPAAPQQRDQPCARHVGDRVLCARCGQRFEEHSTWSAP